MADLASWIEANAERLIHATTEALSENELLKSQVAEAVGAFYDALLRSARTYDPTPLYKILFDWVDSASGPIGEDISSLVPVLARLKQATGDQILQLNAPEDAIPLLLTADAIYTDALVFLSAIEAEALMVDASQRQKSLEKQIAQLNKSKSDFIAIAAHELKTPLTVIEGYTGMIYNSPLARQDGSLEQLAGGIESGVHRLREIVEDLVDVSMIELKMLTLHVQPLFLHHILDAVERSVQDYVVQRNQQLTVERDSVPRHAISGDPERLLQVLHKVITNAIKYTPDGGQIVVAGRERSGFLDLTVQDSGIGISARQLGRIFDAFSSTGDVSLHSSGKVKFKGNGPGLGLPIARGIIEAHGGSIWAESPGYNEQTCPGSTFHIMIPLRDQPPPQAG
jgi:signal transduction histidine kinase